MIPTNFIQHSMKQTVSFGRTDSGVQGGQEAFVGQRIKSKEEKQQLSECLVPQSALSGVRGPTAGLALGVWLTRDAGLLGRGAFTGTRTSPKGPTGNGSIGGLGGYFKTENLPFHPKRFTNLQKVLRRKAGKSEALKEFSVCCKEV